MSIYSYKLAQVQVVINCSNSVAQMCTRDDTLAHNLGAPYIDDAMSYNSQIQYTSLGCRMLVELVPSLVWLYEKVAGW